MIVVPAQKLRDIPDILKSVGSTGHVDGEWFDLSTVPIGEKFKLGCDRWSAFTFVRVDGPGLLDIARAE